MISLVARSEKDKARDVLAAEEFVVPAPDPALRQEPAHDVLAADEFPVPGPASVEDDSSGLPDWSPQVAVAVGGLLLVAAGIAKLRPRRKPKAS